jgi:two-component system sensor histidine kinase BaeS
LRFKLAYKLFLVFWLTSLMIVVLMVMIMQFYTSRSFHMYANKVEMERMGALLAELTSEYQQYHGWEHLRHNLEAWRELLRPKPPRPQGGGENTRWLPPPRPPLPLEGQTPPNAPLPPPGFDPLRIGTRLSLFDANKQPVIGFALSTSNHILEPVIVAGKTVGWLGMRKSEGLRHSLDIEFSKEQTKAFILIGVSILFLVTIVAFVLSRYLTAPIQLLIAGTRAVTAKQFDTRIEVSSGDELGQLASDFNIMASAMEKYEQQRQQWISDISHEMRTPLAVLQGEIEAMQDGIRNTSPESLDSLHAEVRNISKIVNDLHDISLAESDMLLTKREPVKPLLVLQETLKSFQIRFDQRDIEVQADLRNADQVFITGDSDRLRQVFSNLLENTLSYVDSPGTLKVWYDLQDSMLFLHFVDSGPGVPPGAVGRLFDRLYRVDRSRVRAQGGSGLGLAISKSIIETLGGEIKAANDPSGGLAFEIRWPLRLT